MIGVLFMFLTLIHATFGHFFANQKPSVRMIFCLSMPGDLSNVIQLTYLVIPSQLCWRGNLLAKGC